MKSVCIGALALICWAMTITNIFTAYHDAAKGKGTGKAGVTSPPQQAQGLALLLTTDKKIYIVGEEMHISLEWINRGKKPFRILSDNTFVGHQMECRDLDGNICQTQAGYNSWSPKAGVFTGRTVLLRPGQSILVKMDALVDENRKLIFSNLFEREGSSGFQEFKKKLNLPADFPDKYIAAGKIIQVPGPGTYHLCYTYEADDHDKQWHFAGAKTPAEASVDLLWIGKTTSNTVEIQIR